MWLSLKQSRLQLNGESPVIFRRARGYWVECVDGRIWLTVSGQPGDFLLAAGERLRIESNGLALVSGCPAGSLRLYREAWWPQSPLRGWWSRRRAGRSGADAAPAGVEVPLAGA